MWWLRGDTELGSKEALRQANITTFARGDLLDSVKERREEINIPYKEMEDAQLLVGFDAKRVVSNGTGLGSYGRNLVNALAHLSLTTDLRLYAPDGGREALRAQVTEHPNVQLVYPQRAWCRLQKDLWRAGGVVADLRRDGVQLYHGLSGELPRGLKRAGIPGVVTIHDLIFLRHPEFYHWLDVKLYARKFQRTCREASMMIAISECTKRDILHYSDFPAERIRVIYQGAGQYFTREVSEAEKAAVRAQYRLPERYLLYVGTVEERKNLLLAAQALRCLPKEASLVVVGGLTKYFAKVRAFLREHQLERRVHFLQGVPNEALPALYQGGEVFVYPSRYEGFGLPILEALQSGLPVVACTGSCLEEAGGEGSLYVHPDDVEGMAAAITRLLRGSVEREARIAQNRAYVKRFEGLNPAQRVWEVYQEVLAARR